MDRIKKSLCLKILIISVLLNAAYGCAGTKEQPADRSEADKPKASVSDSEVKAAEAPAEEKTSEEKLVSGNIDNDKESSEEKKVKNAASVPASAGVGSAGRQGAETISFSAKGDAPWNLKAEKIQYDDKTKRARAAAIIWELLDKSGKIMLTVKGDAAVVNIETQGVAFEGPVSASGSNGETLVCSKLIWDSSAKKLRGSKGVKVVRAGSVMTGRELTASPDLKQVEVSGDVRISFVSENK